MYKIHRCPCSLHLYHMDYLNIHWYLWKKIRFEKINVRIQKLVPAVPTFSLLKQNIRLWNNEDCPIAREAVRILCLAAGTANDLIDVTFESFFCLWSQNLWLTHTACSVALVAIIARAVIRAFNVGTKCVVITGMGVG